MSRPVTEEGRVWTGAFVEARFGVRVHTDSQGSVVPVDRLVGLALRRNPRRAHLLVSTVLAKHVPTDPATSIAAAGVLGLMVADRLASGGDRSPSARAGELGAQLTAVLDGRTGAEPLRARLVAERTLDPALSVVGYAETATGLGRVVADTLGASYIHSTRHDVPSVTPFAGFEEEHSHATSHRLLPRESEWFLRGGTIVLVDDEVSTGSTIINTIRSLHAVVPQSRWVVAALIDLRSPIDRARFDDLETEIGSSIDVVALGTGGVDLPAGLLDDAREFLEPETETAAGEAADAGDSPTGSASASGSVSFVDLTALPAVPGDRFGTRFAERPDVLAGSGQRGQGLPGQIAAAVVSAPASTLLVLGTEEFIGLPLAVADALASTTTAEVAFSTTTRSPIHPLDRPDYAIQTSIRFRRHDATVDDEPRRYAYNLTRGGRRFDHVVLMPEPGTDPRALRGAGSVTEALADVCDRVTVILLAAPEAPPEPTHA